MDIIDNNSLEILKFLYDADSKTVREIMNSFELHAETRREYINSLIACFVSEGYIGIIVGSHQYILKHNCHEYFRQCACQEIDPILPDYGVYLLPSGRAVVENAQRQKWYFILPLTISIISALVSAIAIIVELFI